MSTLKTKSKKVRLAQAIVAITLPVLLLIANTKLLMTDAFIDYEYGKASFPEDTAVPSGGYSLPPAERINLAKIALRSVTSPEGMQLLREARFERTNQPAFNQREIRHMDDVRILIGWSNLVFFGGQLLFVVGLAWLLHPAATRPAAAQALLTSAVSTLVLALGLVGFVLVNFGTFFTQFHHLFFEGDTWLFRPDDTLIRLFPRPFWFDAALFIGGLTALELIVVGGISWWWLTRKAGKTNAVEAKC